MRKLYKKNIFKLILGIIITFISFEIFSYGTESTLPSYVYLNRDFGYIFKKGFSYYEITEGLGMGKLYSEYYNGPLIDINKKDNFRIALIGNSFIEGLYILERNSVRAKLESNLGNYINNVEVINFGFSGLDFKRMYFRYENIVKKYSPDMIIFFVNQSSFINEDLNNGPILNYNDSSVNFNMSFSESSSFKIYEKIQFLYNFCTSTLMQRAYSLLKTRSYEDILKNDIVVFRNNNNSKSVKELNILEKNSELKNIDIYKKILKSIANDNQGDIYFFQIDKLSQIYSNEIKNNGFAILNENGYKNISDEDESQLFYWAANNKTGHWNNAAQEKIALFLTNYFKKYFNK